MISHNESCGRCHQLYCTCKEGNMNIDNCNVRVIGTCSICGGRVTVPSVYHSVVPPTPTCEKCGAVPRQSYGPVIPMVPSRPYDTQPFTKPYEWPYDYDIRPMWKSPNDALRDIGIDTQPSWSWTYNDIEYGQ